MAVTISKLDMASRPRVVSLLPGSRVRAGEVQIGFPQVTLLLATALLDLQRKGNLKE